MAPGWVKADFGYAIDSNGKVGSIAVAAPAHAKVYITFTGRSAHAGVNPEDGISAITVAAKAVSRMPLGRIDKETTANFGTFQAVGETNIVSDKVQLIGEARSLVKEKLERQLNAMREACAKVCEETGASFDFRHEIVYSAYKYNDSAPHVKLAMKAIETVGREPLLFHSGGGSDANILNGYGLPTVNLAVGYEHIHTVKEQIPVSELVKVAEVIVQIVKDTAELTK